MTLAAETSILHSFLSKNLITVTMNKYSFNRQIKFILLASAGIILITTFYHIADAHTLTGNPIRDRRDLDLSDAVYHNQKLTNSRNQNGQQQQQQTRQQHQQHNLQTAPSMMQNANQNRCQSGWMWFNNKCWVTTQSRRDFVHAIELCKKMYNSTLPTIHSEDENEFLRQNIDLTNSPIWLYARHNHQYNTTRWLDRSLVNYTRWDAGQPSDKSSLVCIKTEESWYMKKAEPVDGQTECVSFWEDAKWGTQVGCLVLLPVVCEKKLAPISRFANDVNGTEYNLITGRFTHNQQNDPLSLSSYAMGNSMIFNLKLAAISTFITTITYSLHSSVQ